MEAFKKKFNATTLELPLTERNFHLPINDSLFEEYDRRNRRPEPPKDPNKPDVDDLIYERKMIENRVKKNSYGFDSPDFKFHLKFGKFKQVFRSQENLAKFLLNCLNCLSLWLNLNLFQSFVFKSGLFAIKSKSPEEEDSNETKKLNKIEANGESGLIESNLVEAPSKLRTSFDGIFHTQNEKE